MTSQIAKFVGSTWDPPAGTVARYVCFCCLLPARRLCHPQKSLVEDRNRRLAEKNKHALVTGDCACWVLSVPDGPHVGPMNLAIRVVAWPVPSHYLNQCWIIVNRNLRNKLRWNLKLNWYIFIQENACENVVCERRGHFIPGGREFNKLSRQSFQTYGWRGLSSVPLQWRHNGCDVVLDYRRLDCMLKRLFKRSLVKTSKLRSLATVREGGFPSQRVSNAENVSIWWRHHATGGRMVLGLVELRGTMANSAGFSPIYVILVISTYDMTYMYFKWTKDP